MTAVEFYMIGVFAYTLIGLLSVLFMWHQTERPKHKGW